MRTFSVAGWWRKLRRRFAVWFGAFCRPGGPSFWEMMEQAWTSTVDGYDLLAPKFERSAFRTPGGLVVSVGREVARGRVESALDVCCGTGAGVRMLEGLGIPRVVGFDMSAGMLDVARGLSPDAELIQGDVLEMPFHEEFDVAVSFGALGHILPRDQRRFVRQIARALRPGGRFIFITSTMPSMGTLVYWVARTFNAVMHVRNWLHRPPFVMFYLTFTLSEAVALLRTNGFTVEVRDFFRGKYSRLRLVIATRQ